MDTFGIDSPFFRISFLPGFLYRQNPGSPQECGGHLGQCRYHGILRVHRSLRRRKLLGADRRMRRDNLLGQGSLFGRENCGCHDSIPYHGVGDERTEAAGKVNLQMPAFVVPGFGLAG